MNRPGRITLICWLFQFSSPFVWAGPGMIGEDVERVSEKDYPSICRISILMETDDGEVEALCTGSLITEDSILTSAHCFPLQRRHSATVTCGGEYLGRVREFHLPEADEWIDPDRPSPTRDVANVVIRRKSQARPLSLAKSRDAWFEQDGTLKNGISCRMAGFGMDDRGNTGHLLMAKPSNVEFKLMNGLIHMLPTSGWLKTSVNPGDSGGPLLCQAPGLDEEIVGITESYRFQDRKDQRVKNTFVPAWTLP